jgi:hypothetical protein
LDELVDACENGGFDGVGFVFTAEDPYAGVTSTPERTPGGRAAAQAGVCGSGASNSKIGKGNSNDRQAQDA